MTSELIADNRRINLYLSGDITITSTHRRTGQNYNVNRNFRSHARKGYRIKKSTRRNLTSSAFLLFIKKQHELLFLTLTFPKKVRPSQKINPSLNRFLTNLRKNYGLKNYLWTRENTKQGRPHFHILADIPYIPIQKINNAWCSALGSYSSNAVRLPRDGKSIVRDIEKSVKYVTKYITKDEKQYFPERCYSISKEIKAQPIRLSEFDLKYIELDHGKDLKFRFYEHCTTIKIWDFFKKSDYFIEFLGNYTENPETLCRQESQSTAIECKSTGGEVAPVGFQFALDYG